MSAPLNSSGQSGEGGDALRFVQDSVNQGGDPDHEFVCQRRKHTVVIVHDDVLSDPQVFGELFASGEKTCIQLGTKGSIVLSLNDFMILKDSSAKTWSLKKFGEFKEFYL